MSFAISCMKLNSILKILLTFDVIALWYVSPRTGNYENSFDQKQHQDTHFRQGKKSYSAVTTLLAFTFMTLSWISISGLIENQIEFFVSPWNILARIASVDSLAWPESSSQIFFFHQTQNRKLSRNLHLFGYVPLLRLNKVCEDWRPCQRRYRKLDSNFVWSDSHLRFRVFFSSTLVKSRFMISSPSVDVCLFKLRKADFKQLLICLSFNDVVLE